MAKGALPSTGIQLFRKMGTVKRISEKISSQEFSVEHFFHPRPVSAFRAEAPGGSRQSW
jgi:hypothetical protein